MPEPVVPRGKFIRPQQWKYTRQCTHDHVSGRRCGSRVPKDKLFCLAHMGEGCRECTAMMETFKPPKGWSR